MYALHVQDDGNSSFLLVCQCSVAYLSLQTVFMQGCICFPSWPCPVLACFLLLFRAFLSGCFDHYAIKYISGQFANLILHTIKNPEACN